MRSRRRACCSTPPATRHPHGLANSSGLVGTYLTTHAGPGVWATFDEEIRWNKGPPNMAVCEHWNYADAGKDFHGGYAFMSQGPLPRAWAQVVDARRAACGARTCAARCSTTTTRPATCRWPRSSRAPRTASTLADETDQYGLRIPRVTFGYSDNDRRLQRHALALHGPDAGGGRAATTSGPATTPAT